MMESILTSIKKLLGITEECKDFDSDIILAINSVFMTLRQIGVGPDDGFTISDKTTVWNDFVDEGNYEQVKEYVFMKVRMLFDPPTSSIVMDAMKSMAAEYEWRLNIQAETILEDI